MRALGTGTANPGKVGSEAWAQGEVRTWAPRGLGGLRARGLGQVPWLGRSLWDEAVGNPPVYSDVWFSPPFGDSFSYEVTLVLFTFVSNDFEILTRSRRRPETVVKKGKSEVSPEAPLWCLKGGFTARMGRGARVREDDLSFGHFGSELASGKSSRVVQPAAGVRGQG